MAVFVGIEKLSRDVAGNTNTMLHPADRDAHALALAVATIELRDISAAVTVAGSVAAFTWKRCGKFLCPRLQLVQVTECLSFYLGQFRKRSQYSFVVAIGQSLDDVLDRHVILRQRLQRSAG